MPSARAIRPSLALLLLTVLLLFFLAGGCRRDQGEAAPDGAPAAARAAVRDAATDGGPGEPAGEEIARKRGAPGQEDGDRRGAARRAVTNVEVLELAHRDFTVHGIYIGYLLPRERVTLRAEREGMVERVDFEEGQSVSKGAELAQIATRQLTVRRDLARSNHALAEATYRRNLQLSEKKLIPPAQLDVSRTERDVSKYNLELAELELAKSRVTAPFSGTVKTKSIQVGEYVNKGQVLGEILDISRVRALIHVPEKEIRHVRSGKAVTLTFDALPGKTYAGTVKMVGIEADRDSRSFPVEVELVNRAGELLPGMLARVRLETGTFRDQVLIPRHAVLEREQGRVVYLARDGLAEERAVELGVSHDGEVQVLSGLKKGDRLIVTGQQRLTPNEPIAVVREERQPPSGRR